MSRELFEDGALSRYDLIINEIMNLAINRFEWENLPDGLTSYQIENMLLRYGQLFCFEDKNFGFFILPCFNEKRLNVYGLPQFLNVFSLNGSFTKSIDINDGVLIRNNHLGTADYTNFCTYAKRLDDIEMTQDVNLFQQNIPKIILADEDSKLTAKALIDKLKKFKYVVMGKKSLITNVNTTDVLDTTAPFLLADLQQYKTNIKNELLTYLGVNNTDIQKKERLISDEVNSNNEYIKSTLQMLYDIRLKACDEINKNENFTTRYGKINVKLREVFDNGELYNATVGNSGGDKSI